jgi:tricorn protease
MFPVVLVLGSTGSVSQIDSGPNPLVLRDPSISATKIAFSHAGDIWTVPRAGGTATRITSSPGNELLPHFSPDGTQIAFSGQYDGNTDVFVVPVESGSPKRLTAHPGQDRVIGWSPDGKNILFTSFANSEGGYSRAFQVPISGGIPQPLPFPAVTDGALNSTGSHFVYIQNGKSQAAWKKYRGGQMTSIWIAEVATSRWKSIPNKGWDAINPFTIGNDIYYLADPKGVMTLYRFDSETGKSTELVPAVGPDIKTAAGTQDAIVFERFGSLWIYELATKMASRVPIEVKGDFPEIRPKFFDVGAGQNSLDISPSGQRVVGSGRGFIFTAPAKKGNGRILIGEQGIERRNPKWSPDGRTIAFITDESGQEEIALHEVESNKVRRIKLSPSPTVIDSLEWSPDSKKLLATDYSLGLHIVDTVLGGVTRVDSLYRRGRVQFETTWSPDSAWIAYTRDLPNNFGALFLYNLESGQSTQVTDGLADVSALVWDRSGKYLYFLASTDLGLGGDIQDIASYLSANINQSAYCVVLKRGEPSPLAPESDEERIKPSTETKASPSGDQAAKPADPESPRTVVDLENLESRIIALPLPRQPYATLEAGAPGTVLAITLPLRSTAIEAPAGSTRLIKFSFADRKPIVLTSDVQGISVTPDGSKALVVGNDVRIISTAGPTESGEGSVSLTGIQAKIDPQTEWRRMFASAIRKQNIRFYDPGTHGVNLTEVAKRYEPFLASLHSRADLNYLFTEIFGELSVGHMFISGGDIPTRPSIPGGLLGADYTFRNGRYQFKRIFDGERWNPTLYAPLAQPGVEAKPGEYLLAIDGQELTEVNDVYVNLEGKSGKQVKVKIGPNPDGSGSREVVVVPISNEAPLRFRAWAEDNRRRVSEATNGQVGYVHVPDTNVEGWREFIRFYYSQTGKQGMIIDERFNGGGAIADFLVREMIKPIVAGSRTRFGNDFEIPTMGVYGPKAMLINESAGSGGDIFPHLFRFHKVGPIIGKRTWGAMISNYTFTLPDGGRISSPDDAMYNPDGTWMIENVGTAPDREVEYDPYVWRQGKDSQLEAGIEEILKLLARNPVKPLPRPNYPSIPPFKSSGG